MAARVGGPLAVLAGAVLPLVACSQKAGVASAPPAPPCLAASAGEAEAPAGDFMMGAEPLLLGEGPPRRVKVGAFAIDRTEVTNAEFAAFVRATGYITEAERPPNPADYPGIPQHQLRPSSLVFGRAKEAASEAPLTWRVVEGADWRHPNGPGSGIGGRDAEPVVHVSYADALAYAQWRGRDLPTEAEWEYAARGGLEGARYTWSGDQVAVKQANHWQGPFPVLDAGVDGYAYSPAPVGCFPANGFGLYDMAGNVWEWTKDVHGKDGASSSHRVIKGGSYLCSDDFCFRYRPAARQPGPPDTGASHIGFRTVRRLPPDSPS